MAGLSKKGKEMWDGIEQYDGVALSETWVTYENWEKIKDALPRDFAWHCLPAEKEYKKGRAKGGIIMGIKKWITVREWKIGEGKKTMGCKMCKGDTNWCWITVYRNNSWGEFKGEMNSWVEEWIEERGMKVVITGDFNAQTGSGGGVLTEQGELIVRKVKDKVQNREGDNLIEWVEEYGLGILNGGPLDSTEGEWTHVGHKGGSIFDYGIVNVEAREQIGRLYVEESDMSDHMPIVCIYSVNIKEREIRKKRK